jgi:hypothetical protein
MNPVDDDEVAAYVLRKTLFKAGIGLSKELSLLVISELAEEGWELREYKYHMTPARWQQMSEESTSK